LTIPDAARPTPIKSVDAKAAQVDPKSGLPSVHALQQQDGMRRYVNGAGRIIPCSASTTSNVITLTPNDASPLLEKYVFGDVFVFWADATSTDAVTAKVVANPGQAGSAPLATLKVYTSANGVQASADSVLTGGLYQAFYVPTLDSNAGGFALQVTQSAGTAMLASGTVSSAATLDIVLTAHAGYRGLVLVISDFLPATDGAAIWVRFSTDGGATYDATGYNYAFYVVSDTPASAAGGSGSANQIVIAASVGSASTEGYYGEIKLFNRTSAARWSRIFHQGAYIDSGGTPLGRSITGSGAREAAQDTDAIRIMCGSGDIASASWSLHGIL
jgi:hypothetical protein